VPSSPYTPPAVFQQPDPWRATPEQHLWGPRNYYKSPFYLAHSAHFIGEIGYHGCPNVDSIRKFISPGQVWPRRVTEPERESEPWRNNDEWQVHSVYHWQVAPDGKRAIDRDRIQLMANQVQEMFGCIPEDLDTFALASQISQAEAKKFFIESTRARKWSTSGVLWWNLIDGWPQFSDAVVDYYFSKKLAYHYIWRAQRPVLVMLGEPGSGKSLPVIACNDTRRQCELHYRVWEADGGAEVAAGHFTLPPNQNWQVARVRTHASDQRLYLIEWQVDGQQFGNHYLSGTPPFSLDRYRGWLAQIAALPRPF
jgi:beta-mannosidase